MSDDVVILRHGTYNTKAEAMAAYATNVAACLAAGIQIDDTALREELGEQ